MDRVQATGEPGVAQVTQQSGADALPAGAGAVDGHGARGQQPRDGARLGAVLPIPLHRLGPLGRRDREGQMHHTIGVLAVHLVSGVGEDAQHR
jgi:hypothetical protein